MPKWQRLSSRVLLPPNWIRLPTSSSWTTVDDPPASVTKSTPLPSVLRLTKWWYTVFLPIRSSSRKAISSQLMSAACWTVIRLMPAAHTASERLLPKLQILSEGQRSHSSKHLSLPRKAAAQAISAMRYRLTARASATVS